MVHHRLNILHLYHITSLPLNSLLRHQFFIFKSMHCFSCCIDVLTCDKR